MQEISPNIYIETGFGGVTLGVINLSHGLVLIDAPFLTDDIRFWRSSLSNLGGGIDRILINLDVQLDRVLGSRAMDCTVVAHEDLSRYYQSRSFAIKAQVQETGAECELYNNLGSFRWAPPEITFSHEFLIHWDDTPLVLEYCPGAEYGSIWVHIPEERVLFLGDLVIHDQPPFLANADIPIWVNTLQRLMSSEFQNYIFIGGRTNLVRTDQIRKQITFLEKVAGGLEKLAHQQSTFHETEQLIPELLMGFDIPADRENLYRRRLRYGLQQYYIRHYFPEFLNESEDL
jgi:cyclase